jgi:hypothetical protein
VLTLEEKVRAVVSPDDTGAGPLGRMESKLGAGPFTDRDLDLSHWGVYYGLAFAIARAEDPFEPMANVAQRALDVAWPLYLERSGPIAAIGEVSA